MSFQPQQKIPLAQKNEDWKKANMDFLSNNVDFYSGDKRNFLSLYKAAQGQLDVSEYKYVLNPYNTTDENLCKYPAQMRNYDIITPILNLFMGEKADRTPTDEVIVTNSDSLNIFKNQLGQKMLALAAQDFVNQLNTNGTNTGVPTEEIPEYKAFAEEYSENWNDERAIFGQEALNYIRYNCDLKDKYQDAFYDWLVTGHCYSFKEVRDNDVFIEIVPPYELWHGTSPTNFVEDGNFAVRAFRRNINSVVDMFRKELTPDDIDWLESLSKGVIASSALTVTPNIDNLSTSNFPSTYDNQLGLITVFHGVWKSFKEVYILKYTDNLGQQQEREVDNTYVLDKQQGDITIDVEWINEVWEGYKIDTHLYLKIQPILTQRTELNNSSKCKLPYNGRIGYNRHTTTSSIVRSLLNYQSLYNIYHFRAELTLARNKDKIMTMPIGLIPDGWSEEKALWFAETSGIMWFDETKPNAAQVLNAIKGIDLSLGTYVEQIRSLLREIKDEAWDSVGMNRQRYGDSKASDGKGVSEQAIVRSATISREMFRRFEKFEESDKQGLLDISKIAWINGKKSAYVTSDGRKKFFEVNGEDHLEADYGVFVKDSSEEQAKLDKAKNITNMMAQKGGVGASLIFETIDSNNFSQLKKYAKKFEAIQNQLGQDAAKREQDNTQVLQDKINKNDDANRQNKVDVANIMANASIQTADIKHHTDIITTGMNNQINDTPEENTNPLLGELLKAKQDRDKTALHASKQNTDAINADRDLNLKNKKINADIAIAKTNKNKYDK
jgi:hypothetical protein